MYTFHFTTINGCVHMALTCDLYGLLAISKGYQIRILYIRIFCLELNVQFNHECRRTKIHRQNHSTNNSSHRNSYDALSFFGNMLYINGNTLSFVQTFRKYLLFINHESKIKVIGPNNLSFYLIVSWHATKADPY